MQIEVEKKRKTTPGMGRRRYGMYPRMMRMFGSYGRYRYGGY